MGTALARSEAQVDLCRKAASYDLHAQAVDGMDVLAVAAAARACVDRVRSGEPVFLEVKTYRFRPHSMFDPELYRDREEVERWKERDPLVTFPERLEQAGLLEPGDRERLEAEVADEVADAVAFAEAAEFEPVSDLCRFVYAEGAPE